MRIVTLSDVVATKLQVAFGTQPIVLEESVIAALQSALTSSTPVGAPPAPTSCPDPVTVTEVGPAQAKVMNAGWQPGETWLIKFTTGAASQRGGKISIAEYGDGPVMRHGTLSDTPCGAPLLPSSSNCQRSGNGFTFYYYVGTTSYPSTPALKPHTTYYVAYTTEQASGAAVDYIPPK